MCVCVCLFTLPNFRIRFCIISILLMQCSCTVHVALSNIKVILFCASSEEGIILETLKWIQKKKS